MPYEDLIANVQRREDNGQGRQSSNPERLLELLARYKARRAEIRTPLRPPDLSVPSAVNCICCLQI